jgi:hypothetical protein
LKKYFVLTFLFVLPIVAYMFFATAKHNSLFLPTISKKHQDIPMSFKSLKNETVSLKDKITIIGFPGSDLNSAKANLFNLNQKIYNKFEGFNDFQMVMVLPLGNEKQIEDILLEFKRLSNNLGQWHYVFASPKEIQTYFDSFNFKNKLDKNSGTPLVYILDKEINLRGRKDQEFKGKKEYRESYNTISAAELHNEMGDDVKIVLRQYRLALKKNKRKDDFRDKITNEVENKNK